MNLKLIPEGYTLIDDNDFSIVAKYKWYRDRAGDGRYYARRSAYNHNGTKKPKALHRLIMDCPEDMVIDHINGNTLDNRRSNLRICTQQQNNYNRKVYKNSSTGYKGVVLHASGKYRARLQINKQRISLGLYDTAEEAYKAYLNMSKEMYGEYASKLTRKTPCVSQ